MESTSTTPLRNTQLLETTLSMQLNSISLHPVIQFPIRDTVSFLAELVYNLSKVDRYLLLKTSFNDAHDASIENGSYTEQLWPAWNKSRETNLLTT